MDIQLTNQSGNKQSDNIVIDTEKEALTSNTTTANAVVAEQMEQEAGIIPITIEDNALDNKNPAGIASSVFNLGNTAVGAGILAFPWAISQIGYSSAIILIIIFGLMTTFTLNTQMIVNKVIRPNSSYKTVSDVIWPPLKYFVDFIVALSTFGVCIAYLIIVGDYLPDVVRHFSQTENNVLYDRRLWIAIYVVIFLLPTVYHRKLDALKYASLFVLICYTYMLIVIILYASGVLEPCTDNNPDCVGEIRAHPTSVLNYFKSIPTFIFAFGCQINTFGVVNELKNATVTRMNIIILISMIFVFILYSLVGYIGYFTYGDNNKSNLVVAYPSNHEAILVARILLSIAIIFSYPVIMQPCKHSCAALFFRVENASKLALSKPRFLIITTGILILSIIISLVVD
eukprot:345662_1